MPDTHFEQPTRRIAGRSGGGRGPAWLAAWAIGLSVVVGLGLLGRDGDPGDEDAGVVAAASPTAPADPSPDPPALVINEPDPRAVTTVAVQVRGQAMDPIERVELVLLRDGRRLATQVVRPTGSGLFGGVFTVGSPRWPGAATVVAIGRDGEGSPVATARRSIWLAGLAEAAVPGGRGVDPTTSGPVRLGEDGIFGARGVDLTELPGAAWSVDAPGSTPAAGPPWSWPVGQLGWRTNPAQL